MTHSHAGTELVFVTEGACRIHAGDWVEGGVGAMLILPKEVPHRQFNHGFTRTSFITLLADPGFFSEQPRAVKLPLPDPAATWMEQLVDFVVAPTVDHDRASIRQLLGALLSRLNELEQDRAEDSHSRHVSAALKYLEMHLNEPYDAESLARHCGLSVSRINALFRAEVRQSPLQYQIQLRLEKAANLLRSPYNLVQEVAAQCGYADVNYFVRQFRKHFGMSPGRWRQNSPQ